MSNENASNTDVAPHQDHAIKHLFPSNIFFGKSKSNLTIQNERNTASETEHGTTHLKDKTW